MIIVELKGYWLVSWLSCGNCWMWNLDINIYVLDVYGGDWRYFLFYNK